MAQKSDYLKYLFVVLFLFVIYISYLVIKPFLTAVLAGILIAFVFFPVYKFFQKRLKSRTISALLVSLLILLIVLVPVVFFVDNVANEARFSYLRAKQRLASENILGVQCDATNTSPSFLCSVNNLLSEPDFRFYMQDVVSKGATYIITKASNMLLSLPNIALNLFVAFFLAFYLFIEGGTFVERIKRGLPLANHHKKQIFEKLNDMGHAVIYGSIVIALIQGILGGIGFLIFGVSSPILWGIAMTIFALIPFLGTAVIWLPASIILVATGHPGNGIGLAIYGMLIVSTIDNFLRPKLIGKRARVHPVLVLLGAIGGIALMGFIGLFIGPLIIALLKAFIDIYESEHAIGHI
jgi:predicted PurR-regulated permease PerM